MKKSFEKILKYIFIVSLVIVNLNFLQISILADSEQEEYDTYLEDFKDETIDNELVDEHENSNLEDDLTSNDEEIKKIEKDNQELVNNDEYESIKNENVVENINTIENTPNNDTGSSLISYSTHIQSIGWQNEKKDGEFSGTSGESKRLEAIKIQLLGEINGSIEYKTHIQSIGWQDWKKDGELSGTSGESKRLEAIQIKLTGEIADSHDVFYRVHAQQFGWLDWAVNGEKAGTAGYSYRLEAIQIILVEKGANAPGKTDVAFIQRYLNYQTHVQNFGWQNQQYDGDIAGTISESKRLEAIKINLCNPEYKGDIEYRTHIQGIGWQDWKSNGSLSGTNGQSRRLEAIDIRLTNEMAENYDVYYRVHAQSIGWLDWAKNGEHAGTEGYGYRLEAIQIILVKRGDLPPGKTDIAFMKKCLTYQSHVQGIGWQREMHDGFISGTQGQSKRIEAIKVNLYEQDYNGSIEYSSHIQGVGWQDWKSNGQLSGTIGKSKQIEALKIRLTGEISQYYDIYYRVHSQKFGWLDWAKNGDKAGSEGFSYRIEAYQIELVKKGMPAPGNTVTPFYDFKITNQITSNTTVSDVNESKGTFKVTVSNISSVFPVTSVSVPVWCENNQNDIYWYPAIRQSDGSFTAIIDVKKHKYHNGNYKIHTYIRNDYGSNVNTNTNEQYMQLANIFNSEYQGNGFYKLYFSNFEELETLKFAVYSQKEGVNNKKTFTPKNEGYGVFSVLISGRDFKTLGDFTAEVISDGKIINQLNFSINRIDYTPIYYSQIDPNWANYWYGGYRFGPTGCVPTSIAMALSSLANAMIKPIAVADYLFSLGMYNTGGAGAGSLSVKYAVEHWGYRSSAIMSYNELVNQLKMNKIVCAAVGKGYFVHGNYTHEIVLYGYNNGKTYVKDPINSSANGWYSIWDIWSQQSMDPNDRIGGSVFYAVYD